VRKDGGVTDPLPRVWDGRGLPPVAAERIARATRSGVRTSLLSAPAALSLGSVGLDPIGEVMGCIVENIGWQGYAGCGATYGFGSQFLTAPPITIDTRQSRWAAFRPYADAIRRGYATALSRLLQEATALGADGVVGIRLRIDPLGNAREFTALGTAVRARSAVRPSRPFTTDLPGSDVAKLMQSGWVPSGLLVAFEVAIRHDDWQTYTQVGSWVNVEVTGYTELTQHVRGVVRSDIRQQLRRTGADGFVASAIDLHVFEIEPGENHRDHVAEALMVGTSLARFRRLSPVDRPRALTILPVGQLPSTSNRSTRNR
jgi:uncharacterized protein YbjQ (UPF0145 family)